MPFELRPYPMETLSPTSGYIQESWQNSVKPLSVRFAVKMKLPAIDPLPHTHLAHEGFQYAKEQNKANEYVDAVFNAYWQDGLDIGKVDILADIAEKVVLNKAEFKEALGSRKYEQAHKQELKHAYEEARISGVPTFFIGSKRLQGLNSKEVLEKAILEQTESGESSSGESSEVDGC